MADPINFEELRASVSARRQVGEFVQQYDEPVFRAAHNQVVEAMGTENPIERGREWAIRMRQETPADRYLNECRKVCLMLLYGLCNQWRDETNTSVNEDSIVNVFGRDRIIAILNCCMVMDMAQCLYKMLYTGVQVFGMHWLAEQHLNDQWNQELRRVGGRPTMNKRLIWLLNIKRLDLLRGNPVLQHCFRPQAAPWGNLGAADDDDAAMVDPVHFNFAAMRQQVQECSTVEQFRAVYDGDSHQDALRMLRQAIGTQEPLDWAREWAIRMREETQEDVYYNECRKVCLMLLYRLCDCNVDADNTSVTEASIVETFGGHAVVNTLRYCMPMDRAQCLYKMIYPGSTNYGMYWVARPQVEQNPEMWERKLQAAGGQPTMNRRYLQLRAMHGLGLEQENLIDYCLRPQEPDWALNDDEDDEAMEDLP